MRIGSGYQRCRVRFDSGVHGQVGYGRGGSRRPLLGLRRDFRGGAEGTGHRKRRKRGGDRGLTCWVQYGEEF